MWQAVFDCCLTKFLPRFYLNAMIVHAKVFHEQYVLILTVCCSSGASRCEPLYYEKTVKAKYVVLVPFSTPGSRGTRTPLVFPGLLALSISPLLYFLAIVFETSLLDTHPHSCMWLSSLPFLSLSPGFLTRKLTDYALKADIFLLHVISDDVMGTIKAHNRSHALSCMTIFIYSHLDLTAEDVMRFLSRLI
uniref:Uncharacterized protein n=1 Tax=Rhipicephalus zambeziensis TaxID=60191 RepID=A0A224YR94_9ACAR